MANSDIDSTITFHENYGADVAPFLHHLGLIKEPIFIKLHSKKSSWGFKFHINWRHIILNDLIKSSKDLLNNIKILDNASNGMLCNKTMLFDKREFSNTKQIQYICDLINIDYQSVRNKSFVAGNMFMSKTSVFKKSLGKYINDLDKLLYNEKGKICDLNGGTFAHAMERIFGYIISANKLKFCHPKYKITKILNSKAPNKKYFQMITTYNNYCYLLEDVNVYGKIALSSDSIMMIQWYHMDKPVLQKYNMLSKDTISKY